MKIRVVDSIVNTLIESNIKHVYMVTGGAAMHLNDALGNSSFLETHHLHHEQSCSIAAESHSRHNYKPVILNVTAGPGAINALNGVFGAYVDSIPMVVISGQAKTSTLVSSYEGSELRQLGDQEVDICYAVKKMTKYTTQIRNPLEIKYELEKCIYLASTGRPGPCWLDIPIDIQGALIKENEQKRFKPINNSNQIKHEYSLEKNFSILLNKLRVAQRPLIYAGSGIRASNTEKELLELAEKLSIPIVTSWNSNDLIWDEHPLSAGRAGTVGTRTGNYVVQTCDVLIVLGSRLNIRQISYNWECFADQAWICHVDIDKNELDKPTLKQDLKINANLRDFFNYIDLDLLENDLLSSKEYRSKWKKWIRNLKNKYDNYSLLKDKIQLNNKVNPYYFIYSFTKKLEEGQTVIFADGTACVAGFQAAVIKRNQRMYHNSGCASMGYELPASIGAYYSTKRKVYCVAGDGSIMMNIQDLSTISTERLPIAIFILCNQGYHSIRQTQNNFFPNRTVGCGDDSGLKFSDFKKIGEGFGIETLEVKNNIELDKTIDKAIDALKPIIVIIKLDISIPFEPKVTSRRLDDGSMVTSRLEDMSPFLPREEHQSILNSAKNL